MGAIDEKKEEEAKEQALALKFLNSMRGRYIMAQALSVAIKTMSAVPSPHTEVSNIADMEYVRRHVFNFPYEDFQS
jgi:hypothetical protein